MNTATRAAKEAGNLADLDPNPTKLIEIVEIGEQMLMTRGSLTRLSLANDVAKYFAIVPAAFASTYPQLRVFNVMHLTSPTSAILHYVQNLPTSNCRHKRSLGPVIALVRSDPLFDSRRKERRRRAGGTP